MRSNPATYLKIYDEIRKLFAASPEARRLGVKARDFSFNVTGGRCEKCSGTGTVTIEMHFMADIEVKCDACDGRRFQSHILAIKLRNLSINQVLDLTVEDARAAILTEIAAWRGEIDELTAKLVAAGLASWAGGSENSALIVKGQAQLLDDVTALGDLERLRALFDMLETKEAMVRLLDATRGGQGVHIYIGADNPLFGVAGCSMIVAPYSNSREQVVGAIGASGASSAQDGQVAAVGAATLG